MALLVLPRALDASVEQLPNVGPLNAKRLAKLGIKTVRDLLLTLPFGFETYGGPTEIATLEPGTQATVVGIVTSVTAKITRNRRMKLTEAVLGDGSGGKLRIAWFNQMYLAKQLHKGDRIAVAGTVKRGYAGLLEMQNPHHEKLAADEEVQPSRVGGLMPKYHLVDGLTSRRIASWVSSALPLADHIEDLLPEEVRAPHHLLGVVEAVQRGHRPEGDAEFREARRRMAFAELFELQAAFATMRANIALEPATKIPYRQDVIDAFKTGLGFDLTTAQRKATWDAFKDMDRAVPMNRLLDGDVGSGKTAVAAACAAMVHAAGMQSVVMAPTEILAGQHLHRFRAYLEASFPDLRVELLVSGLSAAERRRVRTAAASGHCALVVGTHALIEDDVEFANLGLAVVDEQHRFGTRQRELLRSKGQGRPHFLAMTATPIPRTLALASYGEMTLSVIDEMPPGRTPVETEVIEPDQRGRAYDLVRAAVAAGHQAFVICPLIEESEAVVARSATAEFERLHAEVFREPLRMGLIHGRLKGKEEVMQRFVAGDIQILVATAVVEVGVDVPNATVMMIEGADRFGLAQLHQFRGRVGRGTAASRCLLLADDPSSRTLARLELLVRVRDGFTLAEEDMRLRGMGELMGARQHGMSDVAMDALLQPELLSEVRVEAERIVEQDPELTQHAALKAAGLRPLALTSVS